MDKRSSLFDYTLGPCYKTFYTRPVRKSFFMDKQSSLFALNIIDKEKNVFNTYTLGPC